MMDHIRQRDWNSTKNVYNHFVDERDIDNCVVERIIRNKFWDPMISSDEEAPPGPINWDIIFTKKSSKETQFRRFVPGFRKQPPHPKLSALTKDEHRICIKVLSAQNQHILPNEFVGKPCKADWRVFEEKKEIYSREQEEYLEWAKHLWTTTNCIRALRPKPLVELVYEAEFKMKSQMVQCFPKSYVLAAQIPLKAEKHTCEIVLPKADLIKVDISKLPKVWYPNIYETKESIIRKCPLPEPCTQHPCKFKLPNESEPSVLPLTDIHKELAQYASDNGAEFAASENALECLFETDRTWNLPLSVCEVIGPDGDKSKIIVLSSEFPEKRDPAPTRSYRAFRHLLLHAFTSQSSRMRTESESSLMSLRSQQGATSRTRSQKKGKVLTDSHRAALAFNTALRKVADHHDPSDTDDDDDDDRLEIVLDGDIQNPSENEKNMTNDINDGNGHSSDDQPRKILKARPRSSVDRKTENPETKTDIPESVKEYNGQESTNQESEEDISKLDNQISNTDNLETSKMDSHESSKMDPESSQTAPESKETDSQSPNQMDISQTNNQEEIIGLSDCVCKDSEFATLAARSYKKLQIKNNTTRDQLNIIVHSSHKLKNALSNEVLLEPILEYQLDIGGTLQTPQKIQSLAFSLMLRKNAEIANVRVDGTCGEVVTIETSDLRGFISQHGDMRPDISNTLYTTLSQLAGLLPGEYILKHEPGHGANALLFSRARGGSAPGSAPLQAPGAALTPAEEARLVQTAPRLRPVLLPIHKYRRQLPLAFTYNRDLLVRENNKMAAKKKTPPAAIESEGDSERGGRKKWPKRRGRNKGKK